MQFRFIHRSTVRWRESGFTALVLAVGAVFLAVTHHRVATYVCGNDPMLYLRAARTILRPGHYGAEAVRNALTFVAPGYPLLLAASIRIFGDLSPYWLNAGLWIALLPVLWLVFYRLMGSGRAAGLSVLLMLWILFGGHPLHAPFLFYPFRETPRFFLVIAAYAVLVSRKDRDRSRGIWLLASSVLLLAACAIREPTALVLPGLLAGMGGLSVSWRERFRAWTWFLLPWVVAGGAAWALLDFLTVRDFSQFSVVRYLGNHPVALDRAGRMLRWFPLRSGGWGGLFLVGLGIARAARRSRILLAWFLAPSLLFFVFYAYMQMHDRYFLTVLLFLSVFAGYGLDGVLVGVGKVLLRTGPWMVRHPLSRGVPTGVACCLLAVGLARVSGRMAVWGPRVRASEVREWQALVSGLDPSEDGRTRVAVEQRTRYLEDMLLSYTDVEVLDPKRVDQWPESWHPAHYFRPLNRHALWSTPQWLMHVEVYAHRIMEDRMDVLPVDKGRDVVLRIGAGEYEQCRVCPWQPGRREQPMEVVPGVDHVLWLDFGQSDVSRNKSIRVLGGANGELWLHQRAEGQGLQAVFLDGRRIRSSAAVLVVECEGASPANPMVLVAAGSVPAVFDLGRDRRLSTNRWFPQRDSGSADPACPILCSARELEVRVPEVATASPLRWNVTFRGQFQRLGPGWRVRIAGPGRPDALLAPDPCGNSVSFDAEPGVVVSLRLVLPGDPETRRYLDVSAIELRAGRIVPDGPVASSENKEVPP